MADSSFLDAFAELGAAFEAADQVLTLPVDRVEEDPDNPRQLFDEAEIDALAATLKMRPRLLQPIVVRPADARGRYRIRFGARRFRAVKRAGLSEITAVVRAGDLSPAEALVEQLVENEQREGLSTAELAAAVDRLLDLGLTQAQIAERLGRSRPNIAMLAAVKTMPTELRAEAPKLGARTLYELYGAWKADAARTKSFLKGRDARTITQAEARELAGRLVPTARKVRDPSDGALLDIEAPAAPSATKVSRTGSRGAQLDATPLASSSASRTAVFDVKAGRLRGELVLDDVPTVSDAVRVRLKDGSVRSLAAATVTIVRVRPG